MTAVEQAELHRLERRDVANELRACALPGGPPRDEVILDRPLPERLVHDRRRIVQPEHGIVLGDVGVGRRRYDTVDHGRGKARVVLDPTGERRIARLSECDDQAVHECPVVRKVVAAYDREGTFAGTPSRVESRHDQADRALRALRLREIVPDAGMREVELAGRWIVAIAPFGNGERDDPRAGRGEARTHRVTLVAQEQHLAHAADHAAADAAWTLFDGRVEAILRRKPVANIRRAQAHAADPPGGGFQRQRIVAVNSGLRAMEGADAEMNDADVDGTRIVGRPGDGRGQRRQRTERKAAHTTGCGCSLTRDTSWVGFTNRNAMSSHTSVTAM